MVWAPITALAALLIALGFMIWQFSRDDRKRPQTPAKSGPSKTSEEESRVLSLDNEG